MRISCVDIKNFRGIENGHFVFPKDQRVVCIIGPGDNCKTTLLEAIEWSTSSSWSVNACDADFYNCDTGAPIEIVTSIAEYPEALSDEDKFGLYLRDEDAVIAGIENDEPQDNHETVISIRLTIDSDLEPTWEIIHNDHAPKLISKKDRQLLVCSLVGTDYEKDFLWGKNSVLQKYAKSKEALHNAYTQAMREAANNADLSELDVTADAIEDIGKRYGVSFNGELKNKIILQNGSFTTSVGVFDGEVPFAQRGLGSKRLLSMGMNIALTDGQSVLLVDEIETGLEPYRIYGVINEFRRCHVNQGQIIMTTHSQNVVTECIVQELCVIHRENGFVCFKSLYIDEADVNKNVQGIIRVNPTAFLCPRIIVCEGKTEVGFLRALDTFINKNNDTRISYFGVGTIDGGGDSKCYPLAEKLKDCGYDVCIFMDSDKSEEEDHKSLERSRGIPVYDWDTGNCIETQLFIDSPNTQIEELIELAVDHCSIEKIKQNLKAAFPGGGYMLDEDLVLICFSSQLSNDQKYRLGEVANKNSWFKNIDYGEKMGDIVFEDYNRYAGTRLHKTIDDIINWIENE